MLPPPQESPVEIVNGETISAAELDVEIASARLQLEEQLKKLRQTALSKLIDNRLLQQEAKRRSQSVEDVLRTAVESVEVSSEEVRVAMGKSNEWPPATLPAEAAYRTKRRLEDGKRGEAYRFLMQRLHAQSRIANRLLAASEDLSAGNPSFLGPQTASSTLVVFSDYACSFCRGAKITIQAALKRWPNDLRVIVRHTPLALHPEAPLGAKAALCADDQRRFGDAHRALFQGGRSLQDTIDALVPSLGLDQAAFTHCLSSPHVQARLDRDLSMARRLNVEGTPTLFLDNEKLNGIGELIPRLEKRFSSAERKEDARNAIH